MRMALTSSFGPEELHLLQRNQIESEGNCDSQSEVQDLTEARSSQARGPAGISETSGKIAHAAVPQRASRPGFHGQTSSQHISAGLKRDRDIPGRPRIERTEINSRSQKAPSDTTPTHCRETVREISPPATVGLYGAAHQPQEGLVVGDDHNPDAISFGHVASRDHESAIIDEAIGQTFGGSKMNLQLRLREQGFAHGSFDDIIRQVFSEIPAQRRRDVWGESSKSVITRPLAEAVLSRLTIAYTSSFPDHGKQSDSRRPENKSSQTLQDSGKGSQTKMGRGAAASEDQVRRDA